ncbi:hypothetical protein [Litorilituus lipolyticus]|uniref:Uncharacterized protein n=1 Tax=Litorilituus lipolyticus TaxID=2491017 RepID=A0A502L3H1_9GAMM|nr:hypothetical protein [Litorilituus lipolyticus]TPH18520.1 hypothetical protein EPA86_01800 [Litorilituus lipolyticus]
MTNTNNDENKSLTKQNEEVNTAQAHEQMNVLDDTWAELSQDWQAQPTPKTDIQALLKQTRRRTYGAKLCFALNVIATLSLIVVFIYGLIDNQLGDPFNTYIGFGALISVFFVYFEIKIRAATWRQLCDSPDKAIENALIACRSSMNYMKLSKYSFIPFLVLVNWFVFAIEETTEKSIIPPLLFANGFMLAMFIIFEYLHRKRKKQYQQLLQLMSE